MENRFGSTHRERGLTFARSRRTTLSPSDLVRSARGTSTNATAPPASSLTSVTRMVRRDLARLFMSPEVAHFKDIEVFVPDKDRNDEPDRDDNGHQRGRDNQQHWRLE